MADLVYPQLGNAGRCFFLIYACWCNKCQHTRLTMLLTSVFISIFIPFIFFYSLKYNWDRFQTNHDYITIHHWKQQNNWSNSRFLLKKKSTTKLRVEVKTWHEQKVWHTSLFCARTVSQLLMKICSSYIASSLKNKAAGQFRTETTFLNSVVWKKLSLVFRQKKME